jgi:multimeric flavodoxin WrbA
MRIVLLNGNPLENDQAFEQYLGKLLNALEAKGHQVVHLKLGEMNIAYCNGCWGCWVKTPGECLTQDDSAIVCRELIHSDLALMASPVIMGFTSALLKKVNDKMIPIVHPYTLIDQNEVHHKPRYSHYPRLALLLQKGADTDDEDIQLISEIYSRTALNMKTTLAFTCLTQQPIEEVCDEINRL